MTNPQSTLEAVVWVAIDVAKDRHEALIEAPGWKNRKKVRVQNTAGEFRAFAEFLHGLALPVRIGFEPTGNYHWALAYFLHCEGFHLELISSLALAPSGKPCTTLGIRTILKMPKSSCIS